MVEDQFEYDVDKYRERIEWFNQENDILRIDELRLPEGMTPDSFKEVFHVLMTDFGVVGIDYAQNVLAEYGDLLIPFSSPEEIYEDFREYKEQNPIMRREANQLLEQYELYKSKYGEQLSRN